MNINTPLKSQLPFLQSLWQEAFGDTEEFLDIFYATAFNAERCLCVSTDGTVAAALYWFDCQYENKPIAYIYAVATAKKFRGQGLCHKLMEHTHCHLAELGYEGAILVPGSAELFSFYEKMGYRTCSSVNQITCTSTDQKKNLELRQIDKSEYAALRRQFLPQGGVIQEKENLDFLETQAKFYTGSGFLLAACTEGSVLRGLELLGETRFICDIVNSLGCSKGFFRTPGNDIPLAMYRPLEDSKLLPPTYFGFPFD